MTVLRLRECDPWRAHLLLLVSWCAHRDVDGLGSCLTAFEVICVVLVLFGRLI